MSKNFLGKVLAGAALGGATLLIAPGIALADERSDDWDKGHDKGYSYCSDWKDEKKDDHGKKDEKDHKGKEGDDKKKDDWKDDKKEDDKKDHKGYEEDKKKEDDSKKDDKDHKGYKEDDKKDDDKKDCDVPKGWVEGGDGGSTTDHNLATTGAALLGAASIGGIALMRRRRTDGSLA